MSYVAKTYEFIEKLQKLFNKKLFNVAFVAIASTGLFFGVMNVYAQTDVDVSAVNLKVNWTGIKAFANITNGVEKGQTDATTGNIVTATVGAKNILSVMIPSATEGADILESDPDVPEDMKAGLMGVADNTLTYAYTNYPSANVAEHLAQEWVPGYNDSTTSTYADDGTNIPGYDTLMNSGIAPLWSKIRNLAYVFFVVIMIAVGFMIMFRSKIGGQTLVSLGNFLPGVITSLILITFSFAIAGLLIDIGGVITSLIASLYGADNVKTINSLGSLMGAALTGGGGIAAITSGIFGGGVLAFTAKAGIAALAGAAGAPILATAAAGLGLVMLLVALLIVGIVFVGGIKVLITLYKAFFGILLGVIIAPIQIMIGAFPGSSYSTSNWFKSLLKNVLTFPMVFAIVNFPTFLANQSDIKLTLPEKLSYATTDGMNVGATGALALFILRVVVLYFAAESPKYLEAWFPSDTPKPVAEGLANAKANLSKVPIVGGLFK